MWCIDYVFILVCSTIRIIEYTDNNQYYIIKHLLTSNNRDNMKHQLERVRVSVIISIHDCIFVPCTNMRFDKYNY